MVKALSYEGKIWFEEEGYYDEEVLSVAFYDSKVNYIHLNSVRIGVVEKEGGFINNSRAGDFYGIRKGKLVLSTLG